MRRLLKELREYAFALAVAFLVTTFGFTTVGVAGRSMEPTLYGGTGELPESLLAGDRLFVPKVETRLRRAGLMPHYGRGDIVIVREPADSPLRQGRRTIVVKRVIGIPGDTVEGQRGQLWINGKRLRQIDADFLRGVELGKVSFAKVTLGEDDYFIVGDNRTRSGDSRRYGPVPFMSIAGRATAVIWPLVRRGEPNVKRLRPPEAFSRPEP